MKRRVGKKTVNRLLSVDDVKRIHEYLEKEKRGTTERILPEGIKSIPLLESAVGRQEAGLDSIMIYPTITSNAATLVYGICCNHPFHNGNKRTALLSLLLHLFKNDCSLVGVNHKEIYKFILDIAAHKLIDSENMVELKRKIEDGEISRSEGEVKAIEKWLTGKVREITRGERKIKYRDLRKILRHHGYELENPDGNSIEVIKYVSGIFKKNKRKHITSISYSGEHRPVHIEVIKKIRRECNLEVENSIDSKSFYDLDEKLCELLTDYSSILKKLANK